MVHRPRPHVCYRQGHAPEAAADPPPRAADPAVASLVPEPEPRCVVLRHDLPDGSWHLDWMIQRPPAANGAAGTLLTFRTAFRLDLVAPPPHAQGSVEFEAQRLGEHRPEYLEYEGPLTGNRGTVRREAAARVLRLREFGSWLEVELDFGAGPRLWTGRRLGASDRWMFRGQG